MTPHQVKLWQLLALPAWQCAHPERLPFAPLPAVPAADVLIVLGQGKILPASFSGDIMCALSLTDSQLQVMDEAAWLAEDKPSAPILLGFNITSSVEAFSWHASLPLSATDKKALWSRLCHLYFAH
ncbi:DNA polymerase III subunit psi [Oceanisphaera pacifica]|uniref:DNA polymerase III subunit psi n=1 Tax=Oceanisphaera pacifica TaxID=2818389 RepID=A0ABS3NCJ5_9GAMM|nr:DNA polymerase III subunit psi [Oceanisphaera pacifica]MBO1518317.1 DNA polymerase III subunit psi [Oceanisphaera pacifica]